jgi:hypothetical protein
MKRIKSRERHEYMEWRSDDTSFSDTDDKIIKFNCLIKAGYITENGERL